MPAATPIMPAAAAATVAGWRRDLAWIAAAALCCGVVGFGATLRGHFLGDDFGYVGRFYAYPFAQWPRLFVQSWAGDIWGFQLRELRPVTALSFMLDARLWGGNALGFRVTNLLLHTLCGMMVGALAWRVANRSLACGLAAAVLFALHPAHAEPVQWITGRVDVLATTFYLAAFCGFVRYRSQPSPWLAAGIALLYALAAFSKEFGLVVPILFLLADLTWLRGSVRWRELRTWAPYVACLAVVCVYAWCRRTAFGAGGVGASLPDAATLPAQFAQRQLTYLCYLFLPPNTWPQQGASLAVAHPLRLFGAIAFFALAGIAAWRWFVTWRPVDERRGTVLFALWWYVATTLPLVVTYISARHLYVATAGLCVAMAVVLHAVIRWRTLFVGAVLAIAALFAFRLIAAMRPWNAAARISGEIAREVKALDPLAKAGGALLLDVPEIHDGAYVWTWAVPFALRPPFTQTALAERLVVFESRGLYVDWERWHEQPALAALKLVAAESTVLQLPPGGVARRISVPAEKVRLAAEHFSAERAKQAPHEAWRAMINEMVAGAPR